MSIKIKSIIKISVMAIALPIALTSCKKDWTCDCASVKPGGTTSNEQYTLNNLSKNDAIAECDEIATEGAFESRNCAVE